MNLTVDGFERITWADVKPNDLVFIDHSLNGQRPDANPRVSGPYQVCSPLTFTLQTTWKEKRKWDSGEGEFRLFTNAANNLLRVPKG